MQSSSRFNWWSETVLFLAVLAIPDASPAQQPPPPGQATFYQPDKVQTVHLTIKPADWERMRAALPQRVYVRASFRWNGTIMEKVAVRFKGNSSSSPRQQHKRSFLIRFDKYDKSQRFLGMQRVSLDNGVQFGSLFSEPIITGILQDLKIKTHRCNYAQLFLNGKFHGVYVNVERIDESFIARNFSDKMGPLYKVDMGGPGCNLQFIGNDPAAYRRAFEAKSKSAEEKRPQLVQFIRAINEPAKDGFRRRLESVMNVDEFLQTMAVLLLAGAFDQLTGWNPHNYYLYHDGRHWRYLPWDLDVGFCELAFGRIRVLEDWNAAWPVAGGPPRPLLEQIVSDKELLARYRAVAQRILEKHFQPQRLTRILDAKYALIKDDLARDPFPHRRVTNPTDRSYEDVVSSMKDFFKKRYALARKQLASPSQRPKIARNPPSRREPRPGARSPQDPSELTAVLGEGAVRLKWKDNAKGELAHLVQRAEGEKGEFRNIMGRPGDKQTQAVDRRIRPGATYRYRVYPVFRSPQGPRGGGSSNVVTVKIKKD